MLWHANKPTPNSVRLSKRFWSVLQKKNCQEKNRALIRSWDPGTCIDHSLIVLKQPSSTLWKLHEPLAKMFTKYTLHYAVKLASPVESRCWLYCVPRGGDLDISRTTRDESIMWYATIMSKKEKRGRIRHKPITVIMSDKKTQTISYFLTKTNNGGPIVSDFIVASRSMSKHPQRDFYVPQFFKKHFIPKRFMGWAYMWVFEDPV